VLNELVHSRQLFNRHLFHRDLTQFVRLVTLECTSGVID